MILLAQTLPSATPNAATQSLTELAATAAGDNRLYWEVLWQSFFKSGLWAGLEVAAGIVAVLALLFWGAAFFRGMLEDDVTPALSELVWPFVVVFGLVQDPNGLSNLARWIDAARTLPYVLVDVISARASDPAFNGELTEEWQEINLQSTIRLAGYRVGMEQLVRSLYNQCATLPVGQFSSCLQSRSGEVSAIVQMISANAPSSTFQTEAKEIDDVFSGEADPYTATSRSRTIFARDGSTDVLLAILLSWQKDTLPMVEYALMASATMAPLCLAASLLPIGNRAIIGWLISFSGICVAYVSYYVLVGLASHNYLYNTGGLDSPAYLLKTALIDPALAILIGTGTARSLQSGAGHYFSQPFGYGFGMIRKFW